VSPETRGPYVLAALGKSVRKPQASAATGDQVESARWQRLIQVHTARIESLTQLTTIGQGLITAVTLPAAIGAPLVSIGVAKTWANAVFGLALLAYLTTLGVALRYAFRVLYNRLDESELAGRGKGAMNWRAVAAMTAEEYFSYMRSTHDQDLLESLVEQDWIAAKLIDDKARNVSRAVLWAGLSFVGLGLLVIGRFLIVFST
jgi:hypothetical protein